MKELIKKIQENLSPNLLNRLHLKLKTKCSHPYFGHCYVATETLYRLQGKKLGYKPQVLRIDENTTHWYLCRGDEIVDITKEQFPFPIDYTKGRGCGFLSKQPSKRTQLLINKINDLVNMGL